MRLSIQALVWLAAATPISQAQPMQGKLRARRSLGGGDLRTSIQERDESNQQDFFDSLTTTYQPPVDTQFPAMSDSVVTTSFAPPTAISSIPAFDDADEPLKTTSTTTLATTSSSSTEEDSQVWDELMTSGSKSIDFDMSMPTKSPTKRPAPTSRKPTQQPTKAPTTKRPTIKPTKAPTRSPVSRRPTMKPTMRPTSPRPTMRPTMRPSSPRPTKRPTMRPTTQRPTTRPSKGPTSPEPTLHPTPNPTRRPQALTLWDLIKQAEALSTLEKAIRAAGLQETVKTRNPLTVFTPTDNAFDLLGKGYTNLLISNSNFGLHLANLLTNHLTGTAAYKTSNLTNGLILDTLGSEPITVNVTNNQVYLKTLAATAGVAPNVRLLDFEQTASNGILQRVPQVLSPYWVYLNLKGVMQAVPNQFTTLLELIKIAGLDDTIVSRFSTLIAPTDRAFSELPARTVEYLTNNPAALREVLEYHIIQSVVDFTNYPLGDTIFSSRQGGPVTMTRQERRPGGAIDLFFNEAQSTVFYLAKYNILYEINEVLFPPGFTIPTPGPTQAPTAVRTLYGLVSTTPRYTGITTLIDAAGATTALDNANRGPFTLFAPGNAALIKSVGQAYFNKLTTPSYDLHVTNLVQGHLALKELLSKDLTDGLLITTANNLRLLVSITDNNEVQLVTSGVLSGLQDPINVLAVDSIASNGVLHQIDAAILPNWFFFNAKTALDALPDTFSELSALLKSAQVTRELAMLLESTLCAPNNRALASTPQATLDFLLDPTNQAVLEEVMLYHMIVELIPFTELAIGTYEYPTLQGEPITVTVSQSGTGGKLLRFNEARGAGAGYYLTKDNIIYEIDSLLIPPSLVSLIPASDVAVPSNSPAVVYGGAKTIDSSESDMVGQAAEIPVTKEVAPPQANSQ